MLSQVAPLPAPGATGPFKVVLINPYELGRQPFALAEPAALLKREGFAVTCLDLSLQKLDPEILEDAGLVALYVGMHTATRMAIEAIPRIRDIAPQVHLCVYGLYAPMNQTLLRGLGDSNLAFKDWNTIFPNAAHRPAHASRGDHCHGMRMA